MASETLLNNYYNKGGYNQPGRIGFMMKMIRALRPLTQEEWQIWYLENVHDAQYIDELAQEMFRDIPAKYSVCFEECKAYVYDVMFRRTFNGYNKEKQALSILRFTISPDIQEAPEIWDTTYFIDFYVCGRNNQLIGIQLKPETFYLGNYQDKVDIKGKMRAFCEEKNALAFVLQYRASSGDKMIEFSNPETLKEIKSLL